MARILLTRFSTSDVLCSSTLEKRVTLEHVHVEIKYFIFHIFKQLKAYLRPDIIHLFLLNMY